MEDERWDGCQFRQASSISEAETAHPQPILPLQHFWPYWQHLLHLTISQGLLKKMGGSSDGKLTLSRHHSDGSKDSAAVR
jgi:hypothetical protein